MTSSALYDFLSGAVATGFVVCALFFLRFWRRTHDELFLAFALAFGLLGLGQSLQVIAEIPTEEKGPIYLIRLAAFAVIIVAVLRKNRGAKA